MSRLQVRHLRTGSSGTEIPHQPPTSVKLAAEVELPRFGGLPSPSADSNSSLAQQIASYDGGPVSEMEAGLKMLAEECPNDYETLAREGLMMARTLREDGHEDFTFAAILALTYGHVLGNGSSDCANDLNLVGVAYLNDVR